MHTAANGAAPPEGPPPGPASASAARQRGPARSLFWKIYAWFLLAALAVAATVAVTVFFTDPDLLFPRRRYVPIQMRDQQATRSAEIYERQGAAALRQYLDSLPQIFNRRLPDGARVLDRAYLFDRTGKEVSGAEPPESAAGLIEHAWDNADEHVEVRLHRALVARATVGPGGEPYVFLSSIPRKSLFIPLDWLGWLRVGAVLAAGAAVCYWLARYVTQPVQLLRAATRELTAGNLSARVNPALEEREDEFSELARDFDDMAARIEDLLTAQRRLIADVSHELGSPLTRVNVALGLAFRKAGPEVRPELERIGRETQRLNALIHQLLLLSQLESHAGLEPVETVALRALVEDVAADASFEAESSGRRVRVAADGQTPDVRGVHHLLRSAVDNVVRNAVRHTAPDTEVLIELQASAPFPATSGGNGSGGAGGTSVIVRVRDCGPGVPPGELEKLFQPFYRVSEARERQSGGVGLGLAITERAVRAHGGTVRAYNAPGGGLCVEIELKTAANFRMPERPPSSG
jgi:two-component system sensor histidine kinase CpxA